MPLSFFAASPGTHRLEDDGTIGNNRSRLRGPDGSVTEFNHPADELFFAAKTRSVSLIVDLADSLGAATFRAGESGYARLNFVEIRNLQTTGRIILDANTMIGGSGNDWYIVRNSSDIVTELAGGNDQVFSYVNWTLGAGQQVETLSTTNQTTTVPINLTGNSLTQTIYGNAGANELDSGGGGDALVGLDGNDTYVVRSALDRVYETGFGGTFDRVFASTSYTLSNDAAIDLLATLNPASTSSINLTGNAFSQDIIGNAGANRLDGGSGNDILEGRGGADVFAFTTAFGAGNIDAIADFQTGADKLGVAGISQAQLAAGAFRVGAAAQDADDRIIYDPATGRLFYDGDGSGAGAAVQFAKIEPGLNLSANDFITI
jgi:Ca2+-binding RTX toxin-like protein